MPFLFRVTYEDMDDWSFDALKEFSFCNDIVYQYLDWGAFPRTILKFIAILRDFAFQQRCCKAKVCLNVI